MKNIRHVGLVVKNLSDSLKFYHEILGLKIQGKTEEEEEYISKLIGINNTKMKTLKLSADDSATRIELIEFLTPKSENRNKNNLNTYGFTHVAITVKNLDEIYKKLKNENIKCNTPPLITPNGTLKIIFCQDFDGNFLELTEEL